MTKQIKILVNCERTKGGLKEGAEIEKDGEGGGGQQMGAPRFPFPKPIKKKNCPLEFEV